MGGVKIVCKIVSLIGFRPNMPNKMYSHLLLELPHLKALILVIFVTMSLENAHEYHFVMCGYLGFSNSSNKEERGQRKKNM